MTYPAFGLVLGSVELMQKCIICRFFRVYESLGESQPHEMLIGILDSLSCGASGYECETIALLLLSDLAQ